MAYCKIKLKRKENVFAKILTYLYFDALNYDILMFILILLINLFNLIFI